MATNLTGADAGRSGFRSSVTAQVPQFHKGPIRAIKMLPLRCFQKEKPVSPDSHSFSMRFHTFVPGRLVVQDGPMTISAGVTASIDLTLSIVKRQYVPRQSAAAVREMVVCLRRDERPQAGLFIWIFEHT